MWHRVETQSARAGATLLLNIDDEPAVRPAPAIATTRVDLRSIW